MTSPKNIKKKEQVTPAVASSQEVKICMDNQETRPIPGNEHKRMKNAHKRILCAKKEIRETVPLRRGVTQQVQLYINAIAPKTTAIIPPETWFTMPALVSDPVCAAPLGLVLEASAEPLADLPVAVEPETVAEEEPLADVEEAPVAEEDEEPVVLVIVVMVEAEAVEELSVVVAETLEELAEALLEPVAEELAVAVAPETLKRGM